MYYFLRAVIFLKKLLLGKPHLGIQKPYSVILGGTEKNLVVYFKDNIS